MAEGWAYILVKPVGDATLTLQSNKTFVRGARHRIGRSPACDTVLEGYSIISAEHCCVTTDFEKRSSATTSSTTTKNPGKFFYLKAYLADTSTNGTIVNGRVLRKNERCELENGAKIEMKGKKIPIIMEFHLIPVSEAEVTELKQAPHPTPLAPGSSSAVARLAHSSSSAFASPSTGFVGKLAEASKAPLSARSTVLATSAKSTNDDTPDYPTSSSSSSGPRGRTTVTNVAGGGNGELTVLRQRVKELEVLLANEVSNHEETKKAELAEGDKNKAMQSSLHEKIGSLSREVETATNAREDMQIKWTEAARELELLHKQTESRTEKIRTLERQDKERMSSHQQAEAAMKRAHEAEKVKLTKEIDDAVDARDVADQEVAHHQGVNRQLQEKLGASDARLKQVQEEHDIELKRQKLEFASKQSTLTADIDRLETALQRLREEKDEIKAKFDLQASQLTVLTDSNRDMQEESHKLTRESALLQSKVDSLARDKAKLAEDLERERKTWEEWKRSIEVREQTLRNEASEAVSKMNNKIDEVIAIKKETDTLRASVSEMRSAIGALNTEHTSALKARDESCAEIKHELKVRKYELDRALRQLDKESSTVRAREGKTQDLVLNVDRQLKSVLQDLDKLKSLTTTSSLLLGNGVAAHQQDLLSTTTSTTTTRAFMEISATEQEDQEDEDRAKQQHPVKRARLDQFQLERVVTEEDLSQQEDEKDDEERLQATQADDLDAILEEKEEAHRETQPEADEDVNAPPRQPQQHQSLSMLHSTSDEIVTQGSLPTTQAGEARPSSHQNLDSAGLVDYDQMS